EQRTCVCVILLPARRSRRPSRFPYTTLFRSDRVLGRRGGAALGGGHEDAASGGLVHVHVAGVAAGHGEMAQRGQAGQTGRNTGQDRKSTRLNSSHVKSSYAVFCLKKKKTYKP